MTDDSTASLEPFLAPDDHIDWKTPSVLKRAEELSRGRKDATEVAAACFRFVRDEVQHSGDHARDEGTCRASDVLRHATGWCYAKSHLLAALLRANGVPCGLGYQRLSVHDDGAPYCLHGLNAIYLDGVGWYRVDARGNKPGVEAEFCPPVEQLAYAASAAGEQDLAGVHATPHPAVLRLLSTCNSCQEVLDNLPDVHH
ncbi:Transglutaminase-like superfamily protein [Posidoniimonas polymericola]|uniref:Transglutaminase-like superfamily protein n=1 Tax=Posidoniimonas polymericola TaxID=2528002 RepID=A0A5C5YFM7_9BACT|nr:transglutaminase family protein [Posidoniimonas polymericola]TWT73838.1 Transglutaminase-like superfamily protein [Posidoniimonas polymericola]